MSLFDVTRHEDGIDTKNDDTTLADALQVAVGYDESEPIGTILLLIDTIEVKLPRDRARFLGKLLIAAAG